MSILIFILTFGYYYSTVSLLFLLGYLFVGGVAILRRQKTIKADNEEYFVKAIAAAERDERENRNYYTLHRSSMENLEELHRRRAANGSPILPLFLLVLSMVPMYFIYLPLLTLALPIFLAVVVVYPELIKKFFSLFTPKKVDA